MRIILSTLCAVWIATPVLAQQVVLPPSDPNAKNIVPAKNAETTQFAEWEDRGAIRIAFGKEADSAPANASHYEQTLFNWPTGELRVLRFKKQKNGILHQITFETELYVLEGSAEVDVAGKPVTVKAGDAVFLPSGALRNKNPSAELTVIAWNVGTTSKDPKAKVVRAAEVKATPQALWTDGGKGMVANKPEEIKKAPANALRLTVKRYEFDGNSIRVATLQKGGMSGPGTSQMDALLYIAKGKLGRTEGPESATLVAGDAVRETTGLTGHWDGLDNAVFIASSAPFPKGMAPTKPQ